MTTTRIAERLAEIAHEGGKVLVDLPPDALEPRRKSPGEWVTAADKKSHHLLRRLIADAFPGLPIVMEEQDNEAALPATFVVADELDGTHVYMNGLGNWGITLAYIEQHRVEAGVLFQPATGVLIQTTRGTGTWVGDRRSGCRLQLDDAGPLDRSLISAEINRYLDRDELAWIGRLAGRSAGVRALATAVGDTIDLLLGHTSLYINARGGKVWDFAAASLAVTEAGGIALSCSGKPLDWSRLEMNVLFAAGAEVAAEALSLRVSSQAPPSLGTPSPGTASV